MTTESKQKTASELAWKVAMDECKKMGVAPTSTYYKTITNVYLAGFTAAEKRAEVLVNALVAITICSSRDDASYQASKALKTYRQGDV